jgi:hypothetical protein
MPSSEGIITRLVARVRALLRRDWSGQAGERFRTTTQAISDFAEEHGVTPGELLAEGVELGRRKVAGLANAEFAQAARNFAESEKISVDTELRRRSLTSDLSAREAQTRKARAEARMEEIKALQAELALVEQLQKARVVPYRDEHGNMTILPLPKNLRLKEIVEEMLIDDEDSDNPTFVKQPGRTGVIDDCNVPKGLVHKSKAGEGGRKPKKHNAKKAKPKKAKRTHRK